MMTFSAAFQLLATTEHAQTPTTESLDFSNSNNLLIDGRET